MIVPDDKAKIIFNNIIQDIIYGWHNRLWNNSFNNLDINESANIFVKASLFVLIILIIICKLFINFKYITLLYDEKDRNTYQNNQEKNAELDNNINFGLGFSTLGNNTNFDFGISTSDELLTSSKGNPNLSQPKQVNLNPKF